MAFDIWTALGYAIRVAHQLGPVRGRPVELAGRLAANDAPPRGARDLYCARVRNDAGTPTYVLSDEQVGSAAAQKVYWLPWAQNEAVQIATLDRAEVRFFLTSAMSGCHFLGCNGMVMHMAAGYRQGSGQSPVEHGLTQMVDMGADCGFNTDGRHVLSPADFQQQPTGAMRFSYGTRSPGAGASRAMVMGWKSGQEHQEQWFFAYQELTLRTASYSVWHPLR